MSLYAVQVLTGQEAEVCRRLADRRIATLLPQERRLIRRGGAWREEPYTLFRGYVFVDTEAPLPIYYTVRGQDGVMRWLGGKPRHAGGTEPGRSREHPLAGGARPTPQHRARGDARCAGFCGRAVGAAERPHCAC